MKNYKSKLLLLLVGLLCSATLYLSWLPGEPKYQGRKLSVWLENYPHYKQMDWRESEAAIRSFGTNAIPYIFAEIRRRDGEKATFKKWIWYRGPVLVRRLVGTPPAVKFDESYAPEIFRAIGPLSIPALVDALDDRSSRVRLASVKGLAEFGSESRSAIRALTNLLATVPSGGPMAISITNAISQIELKPMPR